jgi:hypothetical protein
MCVRCDVSAADYVRQEWHRSSGQGRHGCHRKPKPILIGFDKLATSTLWSLIGAIFVYSTVSESAAIIKACEVLTITVSMVITISTNRSTSAISSPSRSLSFSDPECHNGDRMRSWRPSFNNLAYKYAQYLQGNTNITWSYRITTTMDNSIPNMFSVATVHQSPLDEPFFTLSAMLRDAEAIPRANILQDLDMFDNSFFERLPELNTISKEELLSSEYGMGNRDSYSYSQDLSDSVDFYDLADSEERYVTMGSPRT